ncbi:hypothetical protein P154DRAFT_572429 [Amniculicola lignicola CBS 123094]|uniref:BTB domain-containing protein n=1 Tax=Amniculicola lignicola CBS 123094 TaxID=1392246 RepID=A0A6A5WR11_9PLEO|nr:hypothetical protein P154DRAFT_572429 [Amniculicola lignicola CBS 123094]
MASDGSSLTHSSVGERAGRGNKLQTGFSEWCNSKAMSDITIRYGPDGSHEFFGHKIILSESSEAPAKEIPLQGDDPDAVTIMLRACYEGKNEYPAEPVNYAYVEGSSAHHAIQCIHHLNVYEVANKSNVPNLLNQAISNAKKMPLNPGPIVTTRG